MKIVFGLLTLAFLIGAAFFLKLKTSSTLQATIPSAEEQATGSMPNKQLNLEEKASQNNSTPSRNLDHGSANEASAAQETIVEPGKPELNQTATPVTALDNGVLTEGLSEKHKGLAEKAVLSQPFPLRWEKATPVRDKTFFSEKLAGVFEGPVLLTNGKRSHILSIETGGNANGDSFDGSFVMKMRKPDGTPLGESTVNGEISQHFKEDNQAKVLLDVSKSQGRFYYEFDSISREKLEGFVWRKKQDESMVLHGTFILERKE